MIKTIISAILIFLGIAMMSGSVAIVMVNV